MCDKRIQSTLLASLLVFPWHTSSTHIPSMSTLQKYPPFRPTIKLGLWAAISGTVCRGFFASPDTININFTFEIAIHVYFQFHLVDQPAGTTLTDGSLRLTATEFTVNKGALDISFVQFSEIINKTTYDYHIIGHTYFIQIYSHMVGIQRLPVFQTTPALNSDDCSWIQYHNADVGNV